MIRLSTAADAEAIARIYRPVVAGTAIGAAAGLATGVVSLTLSPIHIRRCRRSTLGRSRWSPYH